MFESTLPADAADLMRVSDFRRYLEATAPRDSETSGLATRLSSLNPSLMEDLLRFERAGEDGDARLEPLAVLAAAVRHGRRLRLHLQHESRVLPITVFPAEGQVYCPLPMHLLLGSRLVELRVLHVEPGQLSALGGGRDEANMGQPHLYSVLGPLLWELALRGSREALLPEIAGVAAYRVAPGADFSALSLNGTLAAAVTRLQRETTNLGDIASWPGFDRSRAMRMLNGLYLQAALMVSRSHPAATNDGWVSARP
jgi:hypothetical protein